MRREQNEGRGGGLNLQEKNCSAKFKLSMSFYICICKKCGEGLGGRGEGCSPNTYIQSDIILYMM